jgi:hypothetical protein
MDAGQRALIAEKRSAYEAKTSKKKSDVDADGSADASDPSSRRKPGPIFAHAQDQVGSRLSPG